MSFENDPDRAYAMRLTNVVNFAMLGLAAPEGPTMNSRAKAPFLVKLSGIDSERARTAYEWSR